MWRLLLSHPYHIMQDSQKQHHQEIPNERKKFEKSRDYNYLKALHFPSITLGHIFHSYNLSIVQKTLKTYKNSISWCRGTLALVSLFFRLFYSGLGSTTQLCSTKAFGSLSGALCSSLWHCLLYHRCIGLSESTY